MVKRKSIVKQKQKQTQIVNINLGGRVGAKRKSKPKKKALAQSKASKAPLPAYNPPSIVNFPAGFNQPNVFQPLVAPPPQRQYAVFAEGEQQRLLNTTTTIPVPFTFVGATETLKAPPKEERLVPVPSEEGGEVKAEEEEVVLPTEAEIAEAEALAIEGEPPATAEEEAAIARGFAEASKTNLAVPFTSASSASSLASVDVPVEASVLLEPKPVVNPFNLPVKEGGVEPLGSAEESLASFTSGGGDLSLPQSRFLGGPTLLFSPPLKAESEESRTSFPPLQSSGLTLPPIAPSKPPFFGEKSEEKVKKSAGRPKGSVNRPKEEIAEEKLQKEENLGRKTKSAEEKAFEKAQKEREGGQTILAFPTSTGSYPYLQLEAGLGTEVLKSRATKEVGGLERRRGGGVITPNEQTALGAPPAFLNAPVSFLG
jgi:hypothetical protein